VAAKEGEDLTKSARKDESAAAAHKRKGAQTDAIAVSHAPLTNDAQTPRKSVSRQQQPRQGDPCTEDALLKAE
jgi:hypothetical protein